MKKMRKLISLLMVAVLCVGMFSGVVQADGEEETTNILALGDSITAGYGLADESQCFTELLASATDATVTNEGVSGQTSAELLAAVTAGNYTMEIAQADVVTITIGGNDLMAAFYEIVAETYNTQMATLISLGWATAIDADDVQEALADPTSSLGQTLISALMTTDLTQAVAGSAVFTVAVTDCITNIVSITAAIKAVNPDAVVLVANQYNPYQWLGVDTIDSLFKTAVASYNEALADFASVGGYLVADVCTAFAASETTTLTNADYTTYNFDFHPNAAGHVVIANVMATTYAAYLAEEAEAQAEAEAEALVAAAIAQLQTVIAQADALSEEDYSEENWATIQAALANAEAVLADLVANGTATSYTTVQILAAYQTLATVIADTPTETASSGDTSSTGTTDEDENSGDETDEGNTSGTSGGDTTDASDADGDDTSDTSSNTSSTSGTVTETGDTVVWFYILLLFGAAAGIALIARKKEA